MAERGYIRARLPSARPGVLDVQADGQRYPFELLTAHTNEKNQGASRRSSQHVHDVYHIVLFTQGRNVFLLNGKVTPSSPGLLVITNPGEGHSFLPRQSGMTKYHEVTFALGSDDDPMRANLATLLSFYTGLEIPAVPSTLELAAGQLRAMERMYERLLDGLEQTEPTDWMGVYRTMLDIFAFVAARITPAQHLDPSPDALSDAREYIDRHYTKRLMLPDLSEKAHMSEAHFCRAFKDRFDVSPIRYQQELRIAAARNLLLSTNLRCKEIAARLGYADVYCFSKAFKKNTGRSPSELRQR